MKLFRSVFLLTALFISSQASAGLHLFSFQGTLDSDPAGGIMVYPGGTAIDGVFQLDDGISGIDLPGMRNYYGVFSGIVHVGDNTINFAEGYTSIFNYPTADITFVTMLGGPAWSTGGSISETQAPAPYAIDGFQIRFVLPSHIPTDTPIHSLLADNTLSPPSLYLSYGRTDNSITGNWGQITEIRAVPEPNMAFLMGFGFLSLLAIRKRRR
jgi:hypothetical protein